MYSNETNHTAISVCSINLLFLFCNCYRFISNNVSVKAYDFVAQVKSYADSLHGNVTLVK